MRTMLLSLVKQFSLETLKKSKQLWQRFGKTKLRKQMGELSHVEE